MIFPTITEMIYFKGSAHSDKVSVYTITKDGAAMYVDDFGSYGTLFYSERNNRIFGYMGMEPNEELERKLTFMLQDGKAVHPSDFSKYPVSTAYIDDGYQVNEENITAMLKGDLG